jgi:hypothetical protein
MIHANEFIRQKGIYIRGGLTQRKDKVKSDNSGAENNLLI